MQYSSYFRYTAFIVFIFLAMVPTMVHAETIRSFTSDITVRTNGSLMITETIVYDFEDEDRHGIFRIIPTDHPQEATAWYKYRYIDIDLTGARMDGQTVSYEDESASGEFNIRIGDADRTISGVHTYELTYTVSGALFSEEEMLELYWNVTGDEWKVPIETIVTNVHMPANAYAGQASCYVGDAGSSEQCATAEAGDSLTFTTGDLAPGEGMTVAALLDPTVIDAGMREELRLVWFMLVAGVLLLAGGIYATYRLRTAHYRSMPVIAQYEPYESARPMYAGMLIDGTLDGRDVTAGIVHLAEQGFLRIKHLEKKFLIFDTSDYEIELRKDANEAPGPFLKNVLELLFDDAATIGSTVTLSEIKKDLPKQQLNQKILVQLRKAMREELEHAGFFERTFSFSGPKRVLICGGAVLALLAVLAILLDRILLVLVFGFLGVCIIGVAVAWNRRTVRGYEALNHLKGFKLFLSVTDKERFAFHNAPEKSPELFMQYLPYAIAFGVEEKWAKAFRDLTMPNPEWYEGGNAGAFTATAFAHDMSTFSSSLATSSGSSPSSGGGSAGGGAGGGGGGSW